MKAEASAKETARQEAWRAKLEDKPRKTSARLKNQRGGKV
jgi:hypothetical protein